MILLVILGGANLALSPSVPFEEGHYLELEKQFEKRTAILKAEQQELMNQYYPDRKRQFVAAQSDSVPEDTDAQKEKKNAEQDAQKVKININTASKDSLEILPGIGPTYARRIIKYRNKNDGFETIDELKKIDGIAEKRLENLKPFVKLKDSE